MVVCCIVEMDVYALLKLSPDSDSSLISSRCRELQDRLMTSGDVDAESMRIYLCSTAIMLLEPSSRQCYDLWLDALRDQTPIKIKMARAQIEWFNAHNAHLGLRFDTNMLDQLPSINSKPVATPNHVDESIKKLCRYCSKPLGDQHHIVQCQCTARIGHMDCGEGFFNEFKGKCPVCKQMLLKRHDVSKYLWWNAKSKYKI